MREDDYLVLTGAKIRRFLLGKDKPLQHYLDDSKGMNTTYNVLVASGYSILYVVLLLLIVVAVKNIF